MSASTASNEAATASQANPPSLMALHQSQIELPIHEWYNDRRRDFQARMTAGTQQTLPAHGQIAMSEANKLGQIEDPSQSLIISDRTYTNTTVSIKPPSTSGVSTRPPSEASLSQAPSLTNSGTTESSRFSVNTSLASAVSGFPVVEPGQDHLIPPRPPRFHCAFYFLDCEFASDELSEWKLHCLAHFHPHEPPNSVSCPFCEFTGTFKNGRDAWDARLKHVSLHHAAGYSMASARPDFELFTWLKNRRIIDDAHYKDLMTNGGTDDGSEAVSTATFSDRDERRRRRRRG